RQAFRGLDLGAFGLHREHEAAAHRLAIDDHGTGAAHTMLAAQMYARIASLVAQKVGQRNACLDGTAVATAIDGHGDVVFAHATSRISSASRNVRAKMRLPTVRRYSALAW